MTKAKKAQALIAACVKNLAENEFNTRTFKRVQRCTTSDISTIQLYAKTIVKNGSYTGILMQPRGNVAAVLVNCGLYETTT